jgi:hypothetical protein
VSKKVKIKLNLPGLNEVMKSPGLQDMMQEKGEEVAARASDMSKGGQFETETKTINWIAVTTVRAADDKAIKATFKDNVLRKALDQSADSDIKTKL